MTFARFSVMGKYKNKSSSGDAAEAQEGWVLPPPATMANDATNAAEA